MFTGSGTEADNLAILGIPAPDTPGSVLISEVEHPAVDAPAALLAAHGFEVKRIPVGPSGSVDPDDFASAMDDETRIVSLIHGQNETGVLQPVREVGALCRKRGIPFHTDAAQTAGKLPLDLREDPIDMVTVVGHKIYGPKGVGALVIGPGLPPLRPVTVGGGQEGGAAPARRAFPSPSASPPPSGSRWRNGRTSNPGSAGSGIDSKPVYVRSCAESPSPARTGNGFPAPAMFSSKGSREAPSPRSSTDGVSRSPPVRRATPVHPSPPPRSSPWATPGNSPSAGSGSASARATPNRTGIFSPTPWPRSSPPFAGKDDPLLIENLSPPKGARIAVAMSGGVDSAAAALLLKEAGYDVAGVTLKLFCLGDDPGLESDRSCCSAEAIEDAASTAARLGIPHHVWDFSEPFRERVIDPFREEYFRGRTPNPCVSCNRNVRFRLFLDKVRRSGYPYLATGHYVRLAEIDGARAILRGRDRGKDQSYVLWGIRGEDLPGLVFPVGDLQKDEVRALLSRAGHAVAEKRESQDICFLPDRDLRGFLGMSEEGEIVDGEGNVIGRHDGAARYTIGQRRGLGVAAGEALYVTGVDIAKNRVRLGPESDLYGIGLVAEDANFLVPLEFLGAGPVEAKIRYRHEPAPASIAPMDGDRWEIRFQTPPESRSPPDSPSSSTGGSAFSAAP